VLQAPVPFSQRYDLELELTHETMSGASPWFLVPDAANQPIQVMSGASISETRDDVLVKLNQYRDNARIGFGGGFSTENDYSAVNFAIDGETHFNEKNTTLLGGVGMSFDSIEPTDADLFATRPDDESKKSFSLFTGLSQVLGRRSVLQSTFTLGHARGYLSDPYKQVFQVGGIFLPDSRPDTRWQFAWLTRVRRHVEEVNGTLHFDYQFYRDDWDITSHTVQLAWHQTLWDAIKLIPSVRYYSQSEADFYTPFFSAAPGGGDYSSDYRLSTYGAVSLGLKGEYLFHIPWTGKTEWRATVGWERYFSAADLSHSDASSEAPGLVDFSVVSFGLSVKY
jgi:hypothetical protein